MRDPPRLGTILLVRFRQGEGRRKLLASLNGAQFFPLSSTWPEKPKINEWWRVTVREKLPCAAPIYMVSPVERVSDPELPANGLQLGQEVDVEFHAAHSGDPLARWVFPAGTQLVFPDRLAWKQLPRTGDRWRVKITSCSDPTRGIFHASPIRRFVDLNNLRPQDAVCVTWVADLRHGVVGLIKDTQIKAILDLRGGEWQAQVPLAGSEWRVKLLHFAPRDNAWVVDVVARKSGPHIPHTEERPNGHLIVTFTFDAHGRPLAFLKGVRVVPDRRWTAALRHGETWEVAIVKRLDAVIFVTGLHRVEPKR